MDPFVFPVRHGVSVLASGRLLNLVYATGHPVLRDVVFLQVPCCWHSLIYSGNVAILHLPALAVFAQEHAVHVHVKVEGPFNSKVQSRMFSLAVPRCKRVT